MTTFLFEDLTQKFKAIVTGFLFIRDQKKEATLAYDRSKDIVVENFGADAEIILSPDHRVVIITATKDTIEWRTAYCELARIMAADDAEQKESLKGATNTVTATAIRVFEPKPASNRKRREVK
jgi:hypothetical protein